MKVKSYSKVWNHMSNNERKRCEMRRQKREISVLKSQHLYSVNCVLLPLYIRCFTCCCFVIGQLKCLATLMKLNRKLKNIVVRRLKYLSSSSNYPSLYLFLICGVINITPISNIKKIFFVEKCSLRIWFFVSWKLMVPTDLISTIASKIDQSFPVTEKIVYHLRQEKWKKTWWI